MDENLLRMLAASGYGTGIPGTGIATTGATGAGFMPEMDYRSFLQKVGDLGALDQMKAGLGVGQLGLGVLSYIDQKRLADKQNKLMGQQIEQNRFLIDQAKQRQNDIKTQFGSGGLAAKYI